MPTIRNSPASPLPKTRSLQKRCRVYSTQKSKPYFDWCTCQDLPKGHYPVVEGVFGDRLVQPFIHDCYATVLDRGKAHRFFIAIKNHASLPVNDSIRRKTGVEWRGDIVVLRCGSINTNSFVYMRKGDDKMVDFLIPKFVATISQGSRIVFPTDPKCLMFIRRK